MPDSGGYWLNLAEAQKLSTSPIVPGIIQENIRRGGLLPILPMQQFTGLSMKWNRESTERIARVTTVGEVLTWSDNISYAQQERDLKEIYDQTPLNRYVESQYGTFNNYEAIALRGLQKGCVRKLEDLMLYGDLTYGDGASGKEFDGLHAWAAEGNSNINIDEGEGALSLANMRTLADEMKYDFDFWLMPFNIARRIAAYYQEGGSVVSSRSVVGSFQMMMGDAGRPVLFWDGKPIIRSDYMVAEQANTGLTSASRREKHSSGTAMYSILAVKLGQIAEGDPGATLGFGGPDTTPGDLFGLTVFDKLENYNAKGLRLTGNFALAAASSYSVGRIADITNVAITE